jgi:hypothetical protein
VSADGWGVVLHAGSRLLADLGDRTSLTAGLSDALVGLGRPGVRHDPGRVLAELAVAVAEGAECIGDIAVLADQLALFGAVASDSTVWRLLDRLGAAELAQVAAAISMPGSWWLTRRRSRRRRCSNPPSDTTPIFAFCDDCGQRRREHRHRPHHRPGPGAGADPRPDPARQPAARAADGAGCTKAFLAHIRRLHERHLAAEFSLGWAIGPREPLAIDALPAIAWTPAIDADGEPREGAEVAELTTLPPQALTDYPSGTRILVRRERPHPGAQLSLFEERDGWHYQCLATDTSLGQLAFLDARPPTPESKTGSGAERHRPGPLPQPPVRHQHRLAHPRDARCRPHHLDTDPAPARPTSTGTGRTEDAALPAPAPRRPPHPQRPTTPATHRPPLTPGPSPSPRHSTAARHCPNQPTDPATPTRRPRPQPRQTGRTDPHTHPPEPPDKHQEPPTQTTGE